MSAPESARTCAASAEALFALFDLQVSEAATPYPFLYAVREQQERHQERSQLHLSSPGRGAAPAQTNEHQTDSVVFEFQKAPSQEDFIRGSLYGQRFRLTRIVETCQRAGLSLSLKEPHAWTMRVLKDFICLQLDLKSLLSDDFALELLIGGRLVPLSLPLLAVIRSIEAATGTIVVIYRLAGLDGEATEPHFTVETAKPPAEDASGTAARSNPSRVVRRLLFKSFVRGGGLEHVVRLIPLAPSAAIHQLVALFDMEASDDSHRSSTHQVSVKESELARCWSACLDTARRQRLTNEAFLAAAQLAARGSPELAAIANQLLDLLAKQLTPLEARQQDTSCSPCASAICEQASLWLRRSTPRQQQQQQKQPPARDHRSCTGLTGAFSGAQDAPTAEKERLWLRLLARFGDVPTVLTALRLPLTSAVSIASEHWPKTAVRQCGIMLSFLPRGDLWNALDTCGFIAWCQQTLQDLMSAVRTDVKTGSSNGTEQVPYQRLPSASTQPTGSQTATRALQSGSTEIRIEDLCRFLQLAVTSAPAELQKRLGHFPNSVQVASSLIQLARQPSSIGNAAEDLIEAINRVGGPGSQHLHDAAALLQSTRRQAALLARQRATQAIQRQIDALCQRPEAAACRNESSAAAETCVFCRETNTLDTSDALGTYVVLQALDLSRNWRMLRRQSAVHGHISSANAVEAAVHIEPLWVFSMSTAGLSVAHESCHRRALRNDARALAAYLALVQSCACGPVDSKTAKTIVLFPLCVQGQRTNAQDMLQNLVSSVEKMYPTAPFYPDAQRGAVLRSPLRIRALLLASLALFLYQMGPESVADATSTVGSAPHPAAKTASQGQQRWRPPAEKALSLLPHWVAAILELSSTLTSSDAAAQNAARGETTLSAIELLEADLLCAEVEPQSNAPFSWSASLQKFFCELGQLVFESKSNSLRVGERLAPAWAHVAPPDRASVFEACTPEEPSPLAAAGWTHTLSDDKSVNKPLWPLWIGLACCLVYLTRASWQQVRPHVEAAAQHWASEKPRLAVALALTDAWIHDWRAERHDDGVFLEWLRQHVSAERVAQLHATLDHSVGHLAL